MPSCLARAAIAAAGLAACGAAPGGPPPAAAAGGRITLAFVDVGVLSLDRGAVLQHRTVLVSGSRIERVGPAAEVKAPASATRVAGRGRFLLPGLSDMHVHLHSRIELPLYLASGVTLVMNLHGEPAHLRWRGQVEAGEIPGPAIVTTGPSFAGVHPPGEAARLVAEQARAGYDGVKIYNQPGREEYPAIVAEVRKRGLLLTGHVARAPGFEAALRAGQSIAHAEEFTYSYFNPLGDGDDAHVVYDESRIPEAARLAAAAGISVTATLSMYRDIIRQATELGRYLERPEVRWLPPWLLAGLQPGLNRYANRYSAEELARLRVSLPFQRKLVRALQEAGVPLMTGTDATGVGPVAGFSLHEELEELVASGLTPLQALRAATVNPARYLGRADLGTVEAGTRADLLLLEANPLDDVRHARRVAGVAVMGRWLDAAALQRMVARIPGRYRDEIGLVSGLVASDPARAGAYLEDHDPMGRLAGTALAEAARRQGAPELVRALRRMRREVPGARVASEGAVNDLGYALLAGGRPAEALAVLSANAEDFPRSANAWDSLGEVQAKAGLAAEAVRSYRRALEVDPRYPNAAEARKVVGGQAGP